MTVWLVLGAMAALALALLLPPVLRRRPEAAARAAYDAQIYRDQLAEIARERERGMLDEAEAEAARIEVARRLLAADAEAGGAHPGADRARGAGRLAGVAAVVAAPLAAGALYVALGSPELPGRPAAERAAERAQPGGQASDMAAMVDQLGEKLRSRPNDRQGWSLYAHALSRLGRFDEAVTAWKKAAALDPGNADAMSQLAEAQIAASEGMVTPAALQSLEAALRLDPGEPRARYYRGLAALQAGDGEGALKRWLALEAESPPDAPWRKILADRIRRLADERKIGETELARLRAEAAKSAPARPSAAPPLAGATAPPRGPSADDMKAAQQMAPEDRQAMIRGMVERLAARLEKNPDDLAGWQRLERAWRVLGETAKADEAAARIRALQAKAPAAAPAAPQRGPTAEDMKAAQQMAPEDRQAMVRGMVDRLAARLEKNPDDAEGWVRLGRSYRVLGEMKQARAAYARASALKPDDSDVLIDYIDTIIRTASPNAPMPDALANAAARLVALRPDHPAGHWFSGIARLQAGDKPGAVDHWKRLRTLLDPKGSQHRDLTRRIETLEKEIGK